MKISKFQIDCIRYILVGFKDLVHYLNQIEYLKLESIEHTGVGCIYQYSLKDYKIPLYTENQILSGGQIEAAEFPNGATLTLRIADGIIDSLEILAHDSDFPFYEPVQYNFVSPPINLIEDV